MCKFVYREVFYSPESNVGQRQLHTSVTDYVFPMLKTKSSMSTVKEHLAYM